MKRAAVILSFAACLAAPAYAIGPLGAIVLNYVKQALKDQLVNYAKGQVKEALGLNGGLPGMGRPAMNARPISAEEMAALGRKNGMSPEAIAMLQSSGLFNTEAEPLSDEEWAEYEQTITAMAKAGGGEVPDLSQMKAMMRSMPQMSGVLRTSFNQFHEIKEEQARMREAYGQMSEGEREEVAAELVKQFRETPAEDQPAAMNVLRSNALGLPEDLQQRLLTALR